MTDELKVFTTKTNLCGYQDKNCSVQFLKKNIINENVGVAWHYYNAVKRQIQNQRFIQ